LDSAFKRFDGQTIEGKRKISGEFILALTKISNEIVRDHYVRELANRLQVGEEAILKEIGKTKASQMETGVGQALFAKPAIGKEKLKREVLEDYLLSLAFQSGQWDLLRKRNLTNLIKTYRLSKILATLKDYFQHYQKVNSERLAKMLEPELLESFNQFYLVDLGDLFDDEEKFDKEFNKTLKRLEKIDLMEKLGEISGKIKVLEKEAKLSPEKQKKLKKYHEEFRDLSSNLKSFEEE